MQLANKDRFTDIASDRPALIYLGGIIAYKTFNLYSEVKKYYNSKITSPGGQRDASSV